MKTYRATVTRDDNLWAAVVDGLPPHAIGATDAEHFAELDTEVRDLIAGLTDAAPDDFAIDWRYELGGHDVTKAVEELTEAESRLKAAAAARDEARARMLHILAGTGLSQGAIGDVLGVSHQRVHQLLKAG
jgi:DNA-directed RNA polymerase specialized sigma24 family protein